MSKRTAILVDDEPLLRFHLDKVLADAWPELEILAQCENGKQALEAIEQHNPDIVFLDIQMPVMNGMQVAKELSKREQAPKVVFITAYDQYAIEAFEHQACDYLLKPISEERLDKCIAKLKPSNIEPQVSPDMLAKLVSALDTAPVQKPSFLNWIKAPKGEEIQLISVADIAYFKAEDKYVSLYKVDNGRLEEFLLRTSIKELLSQLDPEKFWQIHRSTVVNVQHIQGVKKELTGKMLVKSHGHSLPVSRAMQSQFNGPW